MLVIVILICIAGSVMSVIVSEEYELAQCFLLLGLLVAVIDLKEDK